MMETIGGNRRLRGAECLEIICRSRVLLRSRFCFCWPVVLARHESRSAQRNAKTPSVSTTCVWTLGLTRHAFGLMRHADDVWIVPQAARPAGDVSVITERRVHATMQRSTPCMRQNSPTGNAAKPVKPTQSKYFGLSEWQLDVWSARLTRSRGACASSRVLR